MIKRPVLPIRDEKARRARSNLRARSRAGAPRVCNPAARRASSRRIFDGFSKTMALGCMQRMSGTGRYGTGHGVACQIPDAYSAMVRSLENFPEPATFTIALRAQPSRSPYSVTNRWSASR